MSIAQLKVFPRRGDSPLEGVGFDHRRATYFWHPVSNITTRCHAKEAFFFGSMFAHWIYRKFLPPQSATKFTSTLL